MDLGKIIFLNNNLENTGIVLFVRLYTCVKKFITKSTIKS